MRVDILTLFPEMFPPVLGHSIVGRARKKGILQVCCHQLRDFSPDSRGRVDDTVFGGGKGMLLMAEPFAGALTGSAHTWGTGRISCICLPEARCWIRKTPSGFPERRAC